MANALHTALTALAEIEATLAITEPDAMQIKKAYPYPPHGEKAFESPSIMHSWSFENEERAPNAHRRRFYTIKTQLFVGKVNVDTARLGYAAAAFDEAYMNLLDRNIMLGESTMFQKLRGEPGIFQPSLLFWNDIGYVGLEYLIDLQVTELTTTEPGI